MFLLGAKRRYVALSYSRIVMFSPLELQKLAVHAWRGYELGFRYWDKTDSLDTTLADYAVSRSQ